MESRIEEVQRELRGAPQRWLVTGVAGFLGSHLLERLLALDQEVTGLDDFSTGSLENLASVRGSVGEARWARFELIEGSVANTADCERACRNTTRILHQAALGSVPRSIRDPAATFEANLTGFARLLAAARAAGVPRFVFASSSSVYGDDPRMPRREDQLGEPLSPYAASKRMGELWARAAHTSLGVETVGLRYFNLFGPRQDPKGAYAAVIPRWCAELMAGSSPTLNGDGSTTRDFCPVTNAVEANLLAAMAGDAALGRAFNVGLGGSVSLLELFHALRSGLARRGVPCADLELTRGPFREGDVLHSCADLTRARAALGYSSRVDFRTGIDWTLDQLAGTAVNGHGGR